MENEIKQFTDKDLVKEIWLSPRDVFRYIVEANYHKYSTLLLVLAGIARAFDRASLKNMGDNQSLLSIVALCVIAGGFFGWMTFYLYAAFMSWTGSWLGGQADTKSILRILSYCMLPNVIALVFLVPQLIVYGNEVFKSDGDMVSAGVFSNLFVYGSIVLEFALGIWTIVFCIIGTSEVQKFNTWKSILNLLLPGIVILIPILIVVMLIGAFN